MSQVKPQLPTELCSVLVCVQRRLDSVLCDRVCSVPGLRARYSWLCSFRTTKISGYSTMVLCIRFSCRLFFRSSSRYLTKTTASLLMIFNRYHDIMHSYLYIQTLLFKSVGYIKKYFRFICSPRLHFLIKNTVTIIKYYSDLKYAVFYLNMC